MPAIKIFMEAEAKQRFHSDQITKTGNMHMNSVISTFPAFNVNKNFSPQREILENTSQALIPGDINSMQDILNQLTAQKKVVKPKMETRTEINMLSQFMNINKESLNSGITVDNVDFGKAPLKVVERLQQLVNQDNSLADVIEKIIKR